MNTAWEPWNKGFQGRLLLKVQFTLMYFFSFPKYRTQRQTFSHYQETLALVILEEKMRGENGDRKTDEWRLAWDGEGDRDWEEGWTPGSQWWNGRLIWNEFEEPVQVKATIYITVPHYSSHLLIIVSVRWRKEENRREGKTKEDIQIQKW